MSELITLAIAKKVLATVDAGLVSGVGVPTPGEMCVEAAVCYALGQEHGDEPSCVSPALRAFKIGLNDSGWSSKTARAKGMRRLALIQLGTAGTLNDKAFADALVDMTIRVVVPGALRAAASIHPKQKHKNALEAAAVRCEAEGSKKAASHAVNAAARAARTASDTPSDAVNAAARAARTASDEAEAARAARAATCAAEAASYAARAATCAAKAASYAASDAASNAASYAASDAAKAASYAASNAASYAASDAVLSKIAEAAVQILIGLGAAGAQWLDLTDQLLIPF